MHAIDVNYERTDLVADPRMIDLSQREGKALPGEGLVHQSGRPVRIAPGTENWRSCPCVDAPRAL